MGKNHFDPFLLQRQHRHSSLAYQTPAEFARRHCVPAAGSPDIKGKALRLQPAGGVVLS
jgi:hypothetical protein